MWGCACRGLSCGGRTVRWVRVVVGVGDLNTWRASGLGGGGGKAVCFIRWEEAGPLHAVRQVGLTGGIQQRRSCLSSDGCPQGSVKGRRLGGSSGLFT